MVKQNEGRSRPDESIRHLRGVGCGRRSALGTESRDQGYYGFTVFGKPVVYGHVSESGRHGLVEDSKTFAPGVSTTLR